MQATFDEFGNPLPVESGSQDYAAAGVASGGYEENGATFSAKQKNKEYLSDPPQPEPGMKIERVSKDSRLQKGVRIFAPVLPASGTKVQVLGVGISPTPEEASMLIEAGHNIEVPVTPRLLKGPLYSILTDSINRSHRLQSERFAYAALVPWLLPKNRRFKPKPSEIEMGAPRVHALIRELQPECIVAFGKQVFDELCSYRISADDARGGWFTYKDTNIPLYLADPVSVYVTQPWMMDVLMTDFREVNRFLCGKFGNMDANVVEEYSEIRTLDQLEELVSYWEQHNLNTFAVDCEWAGPNYVDGRLRSIQFCWAPGKAAYLNFFDEKNERHLGAATLEDGIPDLHVDVGFNQRVAPGEAYTDYKRVGEILGRYLNRPGIGYVGHFFVADSVWMENWLGLEVLGRCVFDTAFALQTVNEYSKMGLEVLAMRYTSLGRYDMELVLWKRDNKKLMDEDDGYGRIPDSIMIPYALKDVDVLMRAMPVLQDELERQNVAGYYREYILPFVSDTFHTFTTVGLPVDRHLFEKTRQFFNWAYRALLQDFRNLLTEQANQKLADFTGIDITLIEALANQRDTGNSQVAVAALRNLIGSNDDPEKLEALIAHWQDVPAFNIRSHPQMRRWLFQVLDLTPVKTTKNSENGMPSMLWEKVLELPEKLQKTLQPAVDKETIEILSQKDSTGSLERLLAVSNVGNQCKGFLKEGDVDEHGELVEENGLAKYMCSDNRIRAMYSLTETGRPRTSHPNILNLSKYHNKGVMMGLVRVLSNQHTNPIFSMPEDLLELLGPEEERQGMSPKDLVKKRMPSIRSIVASPDGWCQVESDYKTAEVRAGAFQSGDTRLLTLILGKDTSFGLYEEGQNTYPVRLRWAENTVVAPEYRQDKYLYHVWREGKEPLPVTESQLKKDEHGQVIHPSFDMHWAVAEECQKKPREIMSDDRDRGAAKVTRFCIAEGELVLTRDRDWQPIQDVLTTDLVWDGVEWVEHAGVVFSGIKNVVSYCGLRATGKHEVWAGGVKMSLQKAIDERLPLDRPVVPVGEGRFGKAFNLSIPPFEEEARTYDILNAGPRNRFTCSGVLVSNSGSYGAAGATIERRIEAVTGIKPEPGSGDLMLEALADSQPVFTEFLNQVAAQPKTGKPLVAASGRIRRFPIHSGELQGMPWRVRQSYLRAMGNEARNFFPQESVAATAQRACRWLNNFYRSNGMQARVMVALYDAVSTLCPLEERFVVAEAHQLFMCDINVWEYHGRYMNYPIDTDLLYRWSWKPSEREKQFLKDRRWRVMDFDREQELMGKLSVIREAFFLARPQVKERLNVI